MPRLLAIVFGIFAVCLLFGEQKVELVVPGYCVQKMNMKHDGECYGQDKDHLTCKGVLITYEASCGQIRVVK